MLRHRTLLETSGDLLGHPGTDAARMPCSDRSAQLAEGRLGLAVTKMEVELIDL